MSEPYEDAEDMRQARGDYEERSEREQWAEDHSYSRYRCPTCHKTFWSDSEPHCDTCEDPNDGRYDLGDIEQRWDGSPIDDGPTPEHYGDSVEDVAQAARQFNTQFLFFMDAMRRNGVLDIDKNTLPYPWCSQPEICSQKGYCPKDPNCGE